MSALITRDLVPAALRRWWRHIGHYPGRDLFTLFAEHAQAHPHRQAVVDGEGVRTYRELHDGVLRLAGSLAGLGVRPGEVQLHIVGRSKEIIIRGGRNISPVEVELLLAQHPAVLAAACVGVPDPVLGERLAACVVTRLCTQPPTLQALADFLVEEHGLETVKLPERLKVLGELPLNPAGKVDKAALRALLHRDSAA